jgi:hypothetical protein
MADSTGSSNLLLRLPENLRNQIYEYCFPVVTSYVRPPNFVVNQQSWQLDSTTRSSATSMRSAGLMRCCRVFYREASEVLHRNTDLHLFCNTTAHCISRYIAAYYTSAEEQFPARLISASTIKAIIEAESNPKTEGQAIGNGTEEARTPVVIINLQFNEDGKLNIAKYHLEEEIGSAVVEFSRQTSANNVQLRCWHEYPLKREKWGSLKAGARRLVLWRLIRQLKALGCKADVQWDLRPSVNGRDHKLGRA